MTSLADIKDANTSNVEHNGGGYSILKFGCAIMVKKKQWYNMIDCDIAKSSLEKLCRQWK